MARWGNSPDTFPMVAGTTFSKSDLYKFVRADSAGHATVVGSTNSYGILGLLWSITPTTASTGVDNVSVAPMVGRLPVRMAASTLAAGGYVACSSAGFGIAPTTDANYLGTIVAGSSGGAGRIVEVVFGPVTSGQSS